MRFVLCYLTQCSTNSKYIIFHTSGAIQYGVPTEVFRLPSVAPKWEDTPKSISLTFASSVSNMLCPFTSLCMQ